MKKLLAASVALLCMYVANAQERTDQFTKKSKIKIGQIYTASHLDGYILSTSIMAKGGNTKWTTPRFTAFLHIGFTTHFNVSNNFGMFSGLGIKNIGFIEKFNNNDSTVKRRVYAIGLPFGIKVGNMFGNYAIIGGGLDFPFHFKEKAFVKRSDKTKTTKWFGQQTASVLPYVFVGAHSKPGIDVKFQYYPTNFLNTDYETKVNGIAYKPYANYNVNLAMLTLGINIPFKIKI